MKPTVLAISGHDPTGGAGIQADVEAILSQSCHPCTLITCLTTQDTHDVRHVHPQPPEHFKAQMDHLLADIPIKAVKIGLLGSVEIASLLAEQLRRHRFDTVILDPILRTSGGTDVTNDQLRRIICEELLPLATVITPNLQEARCLSGQALPHQCAQWLLDKGCQAVLITGGNEPTPLIYNTLYQTGHHKTFTWEKLPGGAHGSGCTLAAALAALLARGLPLEEAVRKAQQYTWNAIKYAFSPGRGQPIPDRFFWS